MSVTRIKINFIAPAITILATAVLLLAGNLPEASAGTCTGKNFPQSISKRHNISCKQAGRVYHRITRSGRMPSSCNRGRARIYGWKVVGTAGFESYHFSKGRMSFIADGGGKC